MAVALPDGAEKIPLKEVLVLRDATWEQVASERLAVETGFLIIELPKGATLESLDEAEMRKHGWIREQTWTPECGEPAPDHPERLCVLPKGHGRGEHHSGGHPGPPLMWVDEVGAET